MSQPPVSAPARRRLKVVCPHDCPSACAVEVEVIDGRTIGRLYGSSQQTYTAGVICANSRSMRASIGSAASFGCIRMYNEDILDLFERVSVGTPVLAI